MATQQNNPYRAGSAVSKVRPPAAGERRLLGSLNKTNHASTRSHRGPKTVGDVTGLLPSALRILQDPILLADSPLATLRQVHQLADARFRAEGEWAAGFALRELLRDHIRRLAESTEEGTLSGQAARFLAGLLSGKTCVAALRAAGASKSTGYARVRPLAFAMLARSLLRS